MGSPAIYGRHTFLRPGYFSTNALRWAGSVRANRSVSLAYPDAVLDPVSERDIAEVAWPR